MGKPRTRLLATNIRRAADPEPTQFGRLKRNALQQYVHVASLGFEPTDLLLLLPGQMRCCCCCCAAAPDALLPLVLLDHSCSSCADHLDEILM
jgi:hypothetical protein